MIPYLVNKLTRTLPVMTIIINSKTDIEKMRIAGKLGAEVLDYITPFVEPGITTDEVNNLCHKYMLEQQNTIPAPLDYAPPGHSPFPRSICTSVNNQICHGIPGPKILKKGDIVNIDITVIKDGYHGDTSRMFFVGKPSIQAKRLCDVTYESMWVGIKKVKEGAFLGDVGHAIQTYAESKGFSVVREFCGHGIGKVFHDEPQVLHYGAPSTGLKLIAGMIFTIEPMINAGKRDIKMMPDGWTVVTKDRSLSAQWEHTILVTKSSFEVLTLSAGSPQPPSSLKHDH
jgi:methionyl aminopeptidase